MTPVSTGQTISHYKVLEKLGEGGMGVVYKAEDLKLKRIVAIKFLPTRLSVHGEERERFTLEAQSASALNHPNICTIYEIDEANNETFIVMEYLDGVTLREWISRKSRESGGYRKLGMKEALDIATQIAEGLEKAHEKGIIHRDIKSENIMVTAEGRAKIMDFGLAKLHGVSKLTKTGSTVGTIAYMSPEQVEGIETDHRSDIFSFGVVLYEMLSGQLPFRAQHETAVMYEIINVDPKPLSEGNEGGDDDLNRIVFKCLEKDREVRYQSMKDIAIDLKRYRRDSEGKRIERKVMPPSERPPSEATAGRSARPRNKWVKIAAAIILVGLIAAAGIYLLPSKGGSIESIAVLPFTNASPDSNSEYLSDGITEGIINSLSRLPGLTVMSRNSVFRYKGSDVDVQGVAKKLNVQAVLVGRITRRADNLTVSTELIDARNNSHLWGEQYDRQLSNVFALQEDISRGISEQLRVKLTGEDEKRLTRRYTENSEAYQLYLKGRFYWNKRTGESLKKGLEYFQQAVDKDPGYALAYAGMADCYVLLSPFSVLSPKEADPKAEAAAKKALDIDEHLAEAHTSLGLALANYEWNYAASEMELKRAIELNPGYATAHHWYGNGVLTMLGRVDEAISEMKKAQQLDPLSLIINADLGVTYLFARKYDLAAGQLQKTIEMDQSFYYAILCLGLTDVYKGEIPKGIDKLMRAKTLDNDPYISAGLGYAYAISGRKDEAHKMLGELEALSKQRYVNPYALAIVYGGLGEKDKAFEFLQKAYEDRTDALTSMNVDPGMDSLRSDPRFGEMLKKVGLEK